MHVALNDAAPHCRDAPKAQEARASGDRTAQVFTPLKGVAPAR